MLLGAVSIMVLSLTSCKKDKYGMVKIFDAVFAYDKADPAAGDHL